ncbi:ParB N-terminal domain-containing protein, partial [Salmonella sp. SAL4457]|uniref:ParB N-terminal domain-containing protein n=1 Tax=Salmonella sp. SAL4457 TaxID=3159912 RepID=UPI0039789F62
MLLEIPVAVLEPALAEHDARADFGDVRELAASIASVGLLQPIGIRERDDLPGMYRVVYG